MRILLYTPNLLVEGAQVVATELACGLKENGQDICVLTNTESVDNKLSLRLKNNNIDIIFNDGASNNYFVRNIGIFLKLFATVYQYKPDVIFVHLDHLYTWIFSLISGVKIVETFHSQPYRLKEICNVRLFNFLYRSHKIYPVILSEQNFREFVENFNISDRSRISIIPNPINISLFNSMVRNSKINVDENVNFVFPARFHKIKNHHFLIKAFSIALESTNNIRLYLAGTGELLEKEREYAKELGVEDKIDFLGYVENMAELLKNSDVFIMSSDSECFPMSLLEAMAVGLPIISTKVGGVVDIIENNGILVEPEDYEGFADAIVLLGSNKKLREEMGKRSYHLCNQYSTNKVVKKYELLFEKVRTNR